MIHKLTYTSQFSTGRVLTQDIKFEKGVTLITGSNEAGKSFILEMIRFGLFGSKALRGGAKDYKKLDVDMSFTVHDTVYRVTRTASNADLAGGELIVTGTKPVNAAIIELFGFNLDVFDIACSINQGEVERLGSMKPTERKAMVDAIVGLDSVEDLEKYAKEQMRDHRLLAEGMASSLIEPTEPVEPEGYVASELLSPQLAEVNAACREMMSLGAYRGLDNPTAPQDPNISDSVESLEASLDTYGALVRLKQELDDINARPVAPSEDVLLSHELWTERLDFLSNNPRPDVSLSTLQGWQEAYQHNAKHDRWMKGSVDCEHCGERTSVTQGIEAVGDAVVEPEMPLCEVERSIRQWESFERMADTWAKLEHAAQPEGDLLNWKEIRDHRRTNELAARKAEIEALLPEVMPNDPAESLAVKRQYLRDVTAYEGDLRDYETDQKRKELADKGLEDAVQKLSTAHTESVAYEVAVTAYRKDKEVYDIRFKALQQEQWTAAEWKTGSEAMKALRGRIKQYLLPSLNTVASNLLQHMTAGERRSIEIDEDFEIMVDGQRLVTLSGSGKAVTNLALRIGLGQVLTNGVFSLLMADEIDGSMDQERADATIQTLVNLDNTVGQILVVSHKSHDIEQKIEVG